VADGLSSRAHFDIFLMTRARHCSKLTKASHAQRTPLNMGALHCVTDNHMHNYTARTSGEVKDMRHPLRFRTSTRGFATTVELQQAMSRGPDPCPRKAFAEEAEWQQARVARSRLGHGGEVVAARRAAARAGCLRVMAASPCD